MVSDARGKNKKTMAMDRWSIYMKRYMKNIPGNLIHNNNKRKNNIIWLTYRKEKWKIIKKNVNVLLYWIEIRDICKRRW